MYKYLYKYLVLICTAFSLDIYANPMVSTDKMLEGVNVTQIATYQNELWIATHGKGVFCLNKSNNELKNFSIKLSNLDSDIFDCIAASDKYVWAGSTDGLYILDRETGVWSKRKFAKGGEYGNWIRSLCYDPYDDCLWIGRFQFLSKYSMSANRFTDYDLTVNNDPHTNNVKMIKLDGDTVVWFGTEAGLHKLNKSRDPQEKGAIEYYNNRDENLRIDGEFVCASDMIFEGSYIWFGLDELVTVKRPNYNLGGLYRYNRKAIWDKYDAAKGMPANGIYALERIGHYIVASTYSFDKFKKEETAKGLVFLNTSTDSIMVLDTQTYGFDKIKCLNFDGNKLWIGAENGLFVLNFFNKFAFFANSANTKEKVNNGSKY